MNRNGHKRGHLLTMVVETVLGVYRTYRVHRSDIEACCGGETTASIDFAFRSVGSIAGGNVSCCIQVQEAGVLLEPKAKVTARTKRDLCQQIVDGGRVRLIIDRYNFEYLLFRTD